MIEKYGKLKEAYIFRKCLGLNDIGGYTSQIVDPETGITQIIDCLNMTTTQEGCIQTIPALSTILTHSAPITSLSAGKRFLYQDSVDTYEVINKVTPVLRFPSVVGPMVHTNVDCRVSTPTTVYRSPDSTLTAAEATLGINPNPPTSRAFYKMPPFKNAFVYNAKLYCINYDDPRFMQYSQDYHYDLWNIGDDFYQHQPPVTQSGAIYTEKSEGNGCIVTIHSGGVQVYDGSGPHDFTSKFYPCDVFSGTLFSGFINKTFGYTHVFVCKDGIYTISPDGVLTNVTVDRTAHLDTLNDSYTHAIIDHGKYLAFGNKVCLEYDFLTKTLMKRDLRSMISSTILEDVTYYAAGNSIIGHTDEMDATVASSVTFPYQDFGSYGAKSVSDLYFTGRCDGTLTVTALDVQGRGWGMSQAIGGVVHELRIKTPRVNLGNHISLTISTNNIIRIEALKAEFSPSTNRTQ